MAKKKVEPDIASRIREAILSKGIKLTVFSRETDIPYPSLMDYYNGARKPGFDALAKIVKFTEVDAVWLLTGTGEMFHQNPLIEEQLFAHITQVLAYAQHKLQMGTWSVQEDSPHTHLYNIEEREIRDRLNTTGELTSMAASIYNRVAKISPETAREEAIQEEVRNILRLKQSLSANYLSSPGDSSA